MCEQYWVINTLVENSLEKKQDRGKKKTKEKITKRREGEGNKIRKKDNRMRF